MLILICIIILFVLTYHKRLISQKLALSEQESKHRFELLSASIQTEEKERQRFARDLHDEIGGLLSTARIKANQAKRLAPENDRSQQILIETTDLIDDTINNVRRISHAILPPLLEKFGLAVALENLVEKLDSKEGTSVFLHASGKPRRLDSRIELSLYRIALELVNNALKHAKADTIDINLSFGQDQMMLQVIDNGIGFNIANIKESSKGLGLKNIESRTLAIDGELNYWSQPDKGTKVTITIAYENRDR